jgi:hypothetical protein
MKREKTKRKKYTRLPCMVRLGKLTKERLDEIGNKGQTYDDVITMLIDHFYDVQNGDQPDEI